MSGKYIVRQPIKDAAGNIIGNEILYHGANQAFSSDSSSSSAEFAAANTIYSFLTQNSPKVLKGTLKGPISVKNRLPSLSKIAPSRTLGRSAICFKWVASTV